MVNLIQISNNNNAVLSKLQNKFNKNIQKIEHLKSHIQKVKNEISLIQTKIASDIIPLEGKLVAIQVKEIQFLDQIFTGNEFKKRDNEKLSAIINERTFDLISKFGVEELNEIFERHNDGISFEEMDKEQEGMAADLMKDMFADMFGIEMDEDADVSTPEKMSEYLEQKMEEEEQKQEEARANRKKTQKQIEKEEKQKLEEKNLNKTSRQIYLELVKEFHPDREKDDLEKERKTLLMQKITEAYEKDDLFELLRLRLELLGTDLEHTTDEQLKYYVKLLNQQIEELDMELEELEMFGQTSPFSPSLYEKFGSDPFQTLEAKFKKEVAKLKKVIKNEEQQLPLYSDKNQVKALIDTYRKTEKRSKKNMFDLSNLF